MKVRQDAWSDENDLLLAETVLRHVREGSTQLNAFEEVGDILNRTASACGFRWNAVVREQYEKSLALAKKQRKQLLRSIGQGKPAKKQLLYTPPEPSIEEPTNIVTNDFPTTSLPTTQVKESAALTLEEVIQFLSSLRGNRYNLSMTQHENESFRHENEQLARKNEDLERQVLKLEKEFKTIEEDYQTLMQIMNRARKLALFEDEDRPSTKFKMDRNGNLEKLAE
ncbi:prespore-specific regulator [Bacillus mesophilus]|uniref:RsfA family transcriptional regulator n=1 Tax=Bacillus mesophilus TaxID=1808955 RepID=A0A6M0Q9D3_9BACI|nr:RsfA family transcriptional regulator [Bacillus mesophilus]MBM7662409.1 prespore-specific regulator [Bacillus mesophilus]NEY72964.1 RsfA family transcriptional regulator [Bacillus mesophilus]